AKNSSVRRKASGNPRTKNVFATKHVSWHRNRERAEREARLSLQLDTHPNIVRHYATEQTGEFFFQALELCACSFDDLFSPGGLGDERENKKALVEELLPGICSAVRFLHTRNISHCNIKPQNILLTRCHTRALLSDFGAAREVGKAGEGSQLGSTGWRAPELIGENCGPVSLAADIFSLGCVFHFFLADGRHPFGEPGEREENIEKGNRVWDRCEADLVEIDLVDKMTKHSPADRPDIDTVLSHPLFWPGKKRLHFLCEVSDLLEREGHNSALWKQIETIRTGLFRGRWFRYVHPVLLEDLQRYRRYNPHSAVDLLRAVRNRRNHPASEPLLDFIVGNTPEEIFFYFSKTFPTLLVDVYNSVRESCFWADLLKQIE
ncbi:MAG: serine/threonine-protein kinase/endoribonuclease IRE1, partial [Amphiamblys sp. WSBS2006]